MKLNKKDAFIFTLRKGINYMEILTGNKDGGRYWA
jgi:hypothetical protein